VLRRWVLPLAAAFIVTAATLFALDAGGLRSKLLSRPAADPQIRSLAVLPLLNLSGDPEQEYFADGMTEELITELSRLSSPKVISRTSIMQYKGERKKALSQIGRELNVDAVMEGSVLRVGNRVRIAAQMIYVPTDQHVMTETYERDLGDVLKLQREVAESIAQQVHVKLTADQQARFHEARQVNREAFEAYLRALSFNSSTYQEIKKKQSYLEQAIQKDPGFAEAHAELGLTYYELGGLRWLSPKDASEAAKQALRTALELDPKNCVVLERLARLSWRSEWDWPTAERGYEYVLGEYPNSGEIHFDYAGFAGISGGGEVAMAELAKARELDPLCPCLSWLELNINYHLRNYKAMMELSRLDLVSLPNNWLFHYWLGVGYEGSGKTLEAVPEYQKAVELSQGNTDPLAALGYAYATTGKRLEARKILRDMQLRFESGYVSPYMIAAVYAGLSDNDKAFEYLEKAYQERSFDLPYFLRADLRMDSLRSDPRFQDLMRRMNFPK